MSAELERLSELMQVEPPPALDELVRARAVAVFERSVSQRDVAAAPVEQPPAPPLVEAPVLALLVRILSG
jgi:hypothetical protein